MKNRTKIADPGGLVVKGNELIEASYSLTLAEQNLVLQAITKVKRGEPVSYLDPYVVTAAEMLGKTGYPNIEMTYRVLKETAANLFDRAIVLKGGNSSMSLRWLSGCKYEPDKAQVVLHFSHLIAPYLSQLSEKFTSYRVGHVDKMKSVYGPRLYELLMQWRDAGQRELTLTEIRRCFNLGESYPTMCDFKKRVIDPAVEDINEYSDHTVSYTQRKQGRNVVALIFKYKLKPEYIPAGEPDQPKTKRKHKPQIPRSTARKGPRLTEALQRLHAVSGHTPCDDETVTQLLALVDQKNKETH